AVVPEPLGGAHWDYDEAAERLKNYLVPALEELEKQNPDERVKNRIDKFGKMGFWEESMA
ncbi:MAG: acetyl-CoA carboxylase carboxyl transferase subunit alpha, partial [Ferruginibacter sp.]|nr:acetyl-CoA carboxylase carboxyl transferase subunit alpha [Ferruginibacter sp.]